MPKLTTHRDFQEVRSLPFCYLCGKPLADTPNEERDFDHVPPKKIFAKQDRSRPLKLPVHKRCHEDASEWDEVTNEFVSLLHDVERPRQVLEKHIEVMTLHSRLTAGLTGVPLVKVIGRFLRGFHAALYGEFLPYETGSAIQPPFPAGSREGGKVMMKGIEAQFPAFIEVLKKSRITGRCDEVVCFNDRCRYFCVWSQFDDGRPCCLFALRIYEWEKLADTTNFPRRACVGMYFTGGVPERATRETLIEVPDWKGDPLDPFTD